MPKSFAEREPEKKLTVFLRPEVYAWLEKRALANGRSRLREAAWHITQAMERETAADRTQGGN